ncbi:hypothetical protein [Fibrella aquatica]|jgi:hypothetical protein|uniref:hypothetical protein n=1 Tax=Fibrella aquatica TaxID=3242487 RepID=UPI0035205CD4
MNEITSPSTPTVARLTDTAALKALLFSVRPSPIQFDWGTDKLVLWIEDLSITGTLLDDMREVISRVAFAIELETAWDHRTDESTYHPLYGYRILLRDAYGLWHGVRVSPAGEFVDTLPLQEMHYEIAYDKVMWID